MLYIAAVLNTFEFPGQDEDLRAKLEQELIEVGPGLMHRKLQQLDPIAASRIDPLNGRRIVRAIEIISVTGEPFAASLPDEPESWQPVLEIGLNSDRAHLVERLNQRVEKMWQRGLVAEVEQLIAQGLREAKTSKRAIGYAQALAQLDGEIPEAEAIEQTKLLTARYARRQMSWFRRDKPQSTFNRWNNHRNSRLPQAFVGTNRSPVLRRMWRKNRQANSTANRRSDSRTARGNKVPTARSGRRPKER
jgi:tRNA dimethylallyltransferase